MRYLYDDEACNLLVGTVAKARLRAIIRDTSEQLQRCGGEHLSNFPRDLREAWRSVCRSIYTRHAHYLADRRRTNLQTRRSCNTSRRLRRSRHARTQYRYFARVNCITCGLPDLGIQLRWRTHARPPPRSYQDHRVLLFDVGSPLSVYRRRAIAVRAPKHDTAYDALTSATARTCRCYFDHLSVTDYLQLAIQPGNNNVSDVR